MSDDGKVELIVSSSVSQFFHERVRAAMSRQRLEARSTAVAYVVNLLAEHLRCEAIVAGAEGTALHTPLAQLLAEARAAPPDERVRRLRRLGDVALYVAGFFSEHLSGRLVDLDYYIAMGGGAYHSVAASLQARAARDLGALYEELAEKFARFVDVFAQISEEARPATNADVLRLYERWQRTRSRWTAERLVEAGVVPMAGADEDEVTN